MKILYKYGVAQVYGLLYFVLKFSFAIILTNCCAILQTKDVLGKDYYGVS